MNTHYDSKPVTQGQNKDQKEKEKQEKVRQFGGKTGDGAEEGDARLRKGRETAAVVWM